MLYVLRWWTLRSAGLLLALAGSGAFADSGAAQWHYSGFGSLALTHTDSDTLGFQRDLHHDASFDRWSFGSDSVLGLQLEGNISKDIEAIVQVVGKDRVDDSIENSVHWALLRYPFSPQWTLRAGRIGLDMFMLSEYRDLGFSYLWLRPPQEFYTPIAFESLDGTDLEWSGVVGEASLRAKLYTGQARNTFLNFDNLVRIRLTRLSGGNLSLETDAWEWRVNAATSRIDDDQGYFPGTRELAGWLMEASPLWPEAANYADNLTAAPGHISFYSVGAAYTYGAWQIQSEAGHIHSNMEIYPTLFTRYASVGRQFDTVTIYSAVSAVDTLARREQFGPAPDIPALPELSLLLGDLQQGLQDVFNSINVNQTSYALGIRWDMQENLALKAQLDHTRIQAYGANLWAQKAIPDRDQVLDTAAVSLDFTF